MTKACGFTMRGLLAKVQKYLTYAFSYSHNLIGNDVPRLQFEITSIQELLDEQPDSKCKPNIAVTILRTHDTCRVYGVSCSLQTTASYQTCGDGGKRGRTFASGWLLGTIGEASGHRSAQAEEI